MGTEEINLLVEPIFKAWTNVFILGFRKGSIIVDYKMEVGVTEANEGFDKDFVENGIRVAIEERKDTTSFDSETVSIEDPDECVSSTLNDCDENAVCRNEKLSFTCVCKQGFVDRGVLPGRLCVDETEDERALKDRVSRVEEDRLKIVVYEKDKEENKEVVDGQFATQGGSIEDLTAMSITALSAL